MRQRSGEVVAQRFMLGEPLGKGGAARVFLARDLETGAQVAVKIVREHTETSGRLPALLREAQLLSRVDHPRVPSVLDFGVTAAGRVYIAMQYAPGETLRDRLALSGPLSPGQVVDVARGVCEVLAAVHDAGLVHGDVKPSNVIVPSGPDDPMTGPWLIDFGIATDQGRRSRTGEIVGTPAYMSPEQAQLDPLDGRSDLYSLGCLLFGLLTGEPPFSGTTFAIMKQHITGPLPLLSPTAPRRVPVALEHLIRQLLGKSPEDRPPSARAVIDALNHLPTEKP